MNGMRLGVADRNRTNVSGITTRGSAIELRPPPSARLCWTRRLDLNQRGLAPPGLQSGAFNHLATSRKLAPRAGLEPATARWTGEYSSSELTKQISKRFRSRVPEPPNRCGRFASRGAGACATSGCWRRVRESNPRCKVENLASWPLDEHDLQTSTSAVPSREPSRRRRRLAARGRVNPPRTSRAAHTGRFCGVGVRGHTRSERKTEKTNEKARILGGIRASGIQSAAGASSDAAASRIESILGLAMLRRPPRRQAAIRQRDGAHARTEAGEGLGGAKGVPAVHDGCPGAFPVRGATKKRLIEIPSLFQATGRSVNSLYCLRKRPAGAVAHNPRSCAGGSQSASRFPAGNRHGT